jgi:6-pyruvoyltetrahydropterin/6-carboxytetrahydropterin synthase
MKIETTATRRIEWDAAHRVMRHESKCATLHGHRYAALITVRAEQLDRVDRVVDFGVVKSLVGRWVDDNLDHTTILNSRDEAMIAAFEIAHLASHHRKPFLVAGEPTAETLAALLAERAQALLDEYVDENPGHARLFVERVRVFETPNCHADAETRA